MQCTRFDRLIIVKYISAGVHTRPQRSMALSRTRFGGRVLARTARPLFVASGIAASWCHRAPGKRRYGKL